MLEQKIIHTHKSQNFDNRTKNVKIKYIILHYTETKTFEEALKLLCSKKRKVSSHFLIDKKGTIFNLVDERKKAWHAGISCWEKNKNLNNNSIGIEIVNEGEEARAKYPKKQIDSLIILLKNLKKKYEIETKYFLAHSDIAPSRKMDPGIFFPWQKLSEQSLGIFPKMKKNSNDFMRLDNRDNILFLKNLKKLGFSEIDLKKSFSQNKKIINAFHRHFIPELLNKYPRIISYKTLQEIINLTFDE